MASTLVSPSLTDSPPSRRASAAEDGIPAPLSPTLSPRKQQIESEISKLWEMFTKIRGSVSCKLVEAIVLNASQTNNAQITAATLPPMAADLDWYSFKEYISRWLRKNEDRHATGSDAMVSAFRRSRQLFATHVRWEYEYQKKKFIPFDESVSGDLEKRYVEGIGECVFDANNEVFEVDLDSLIMYSEKAEFKLRRKVTVLHAADGEALASDSHTVVRDMPSSNTAASWSYRPLAANASDDVAWQHFNRYQAFALERAFREKGLPDIFNLNIGGKEHTIMTVDTIDPVTGRHRGPHIKLLTAVMSGNNNNDVPAQPYSLIRRVLVPREHCHASDVCWRLECPLVYAALAMRETRPGFTRAFRELEQTGEVVLRAETLDDGDDEIYAVLREMVDLWGVAPTAFSVHGDLLRYEVLIEGMWVPMIPMNNWLMQPLTRLTDPKPSAAHGKKAAALQNVFPPHVYNPKPTEHYPEVRSFEHVVFLFKQWLPFDHQTMTVYLPSPAGSGEPGRVLWCRVAEEHETVVRFLLRDNEPWICSRELLLTSSMIPRKFLETNHIVCCPDHSALDCSKVLSWVANKGTKEQRPHECQRAAEFLGFEAQWSGLKSP